MRWWCRCTVLQCRHHFSKTSMSIGLEDVQVIVNFWTQSDHLIQWGWEAWGPDSTPSKHVKSRIRANLWWLPRVFPKVMAIDCWSVMRLLSALILEGSFLIDQKMGIFSSFMYSKVFQGGLTFTCFGLAECDLYKLTHPILTLASLRRMTGKDSTWSCCWHHWSQRRGQIDPLQDDDGNWSLPRFSWGKGKVLLVWLVWCLVGQIPFRCAYYL